MKTRLAFSFLAILILSAAWTMVVSGGSPDDPATAGGKTPLVDYVRPFVGTDGDGDTYPGPTAPFGMVQLSPDTDRGLCSGYSYADPTILGFSMTHLSGTGCADLGDFLFMPQVGKPELNAGDKKNTKAGYQSLFSHSDESASIGYYQVRLLKSSVNVELTVSDRAGMLRMTFPETDEASILDRFESRDRGEWCGRASGSRASQATKTLDTVTGYHLITGWGPDR